MGQLLLLTIGALVVGSIGFGLAVLITGSDPCLRPVEPEGRAVPLPSNRPLVESDVGAVRFDTAMRGYRMNQVDVALRRAAYDIGYKQELIGVLEAEVDALREGRTEDADKLRAARMAALSAVAGGGDGPAADLPVTSTDQTEDDVEEEVDADGAQQEARQS
jgi:DivIVA domain-containing protein